eukprot:362321-Chlamydomonas_euryale.AAC.9
MESAEVAPESSANAPIASLERLATRRVPRKTWPIDLTWQWRNARLALTIPAPSTPRVQASSLPTPLQPACSDRRAGWSTRLGTHVQESKSSLAATATAAMRCGGVSTRAPALKLEAARGQAVRRAQAAASCAAVDARCLGIETRAVESSGMVLRCSCCRRMRCHVYAWQAYACMHACINGIYSVINRHFYLGACPHVYPHVKPRHLNPCTKHACLGLRSRPITPAEPKAGPMPRTCMHVNATRPEAERL